MSTWTRKLTGAFRKLLYSVRWYTNTGHTEQQHPPTVELCRGGLAWNLVAKPFPQGHTFLAVSDPMFKVVDGDGLDATAARTHYIFDLREKDQWLGAANSVHSKARCTADKKVALATIETIAAWLMSPHNDLEEMVASAKEEVMRTLTPDERADLALEVLSEDA